jgi:hypothetical protein
MCAQLSHMANDAHFLSFVRNKKNKTPEPTHDTTSVLFSGAGEKATSMNHHSPFRRSSLALPERLCAGRARVIYHLHAPFALQVLSQLPPNSDKVHE